MQRMPRNLCAIPVILINAGAMWTAFAIRLAAVPKFKLISVTSGCAFGEYLDDVTTALFPARAVQHEILSVACCIELLSAIGADCSSSSFLTRLIGSLPTFPTFSRFLACAVRFPLMTFNYFLRTGTEVISSANCSHNLPGEGPESCTYGRDI